MGYYVRFLEGTLDLHHQVDDGIFSWSEFLNLNLYLNNWHAGWAGGFKGYMAICGSQFDSEGPPDLEDHPRIPK